MGDTELDMESVRPLKPKLPGHMFLKEGNARLCCRDGISDNRYISKADVWFFLNIKYWYRMKFAD